MSTTNHPKHPGKFVRERAGKVKRESHRRQGGQRRPRVTSCSRASCRRQPCGTCGYRHRGTASGRPVLTSIHTQQGQQLSPRNHELTTNKAQSRAHNEQGQQLISRNHELTHQRRSAQTEKNKLAHVVVRLDGVGPHARVRVLEARAGAGDHPGLELRGEGTEVVQVEASGSRCTRVRKGEPPAEARGVEKGGDLVRAERGSACGRRRSALLRRAGLPAVWGAAPDERRTGFQCCPAGWP